MFYNEKPARMLAFEQSNAYSYANIRDHGDHSLRSCILDPWLFRCQMMYLKIK